MQEPAIGVIGGSGLYQLEGLTDPTEHTIETPFGPPSDTLFGGRLAGRQVYFLPRHSRGHRILPHEFNHRANIWAVRSLGVRWIICVVCLCRKTSISTGSSLGASRGSVQIQKQTLIASCLGSKAKTQPWRARISSTVRIAWCISSGT